ncbi:MAG: IS66 family insertion sequence element accessory protein TnpB [Thiotrichaceae bacterium]
MSYTTQDQTLQRSTHMKMFVDVQKIYLYRDPVDFRKAIDGLALIVEQEMNLSSFEVAVFVFCNKGRDKVKALYWDRTGFCLWYKRLEKQTFKWPRNQPDEVLFLSESQWQSLLSGFPIMGHQSLNFTSLF